jgi:surfeit locus 1 family protein
VAFRPLPILTLASIPALALLIFLGVWQLGRAQQKRALIASYEAAVVAQPADDLYTPYCTLPADAPARTAVMPAALEGAEVRFFGSRAEDGAPGWRLLRLTPEPDCSCDPRAGGGDCLSPERRLVVEAGFETLSGERSGPSAVVLIAPPPAIGLFTPANAPERGEFYRFDVAELAGAFGVSADAIEPAWRLAPLPPGLPPGLADMPPSRHVGYALTWFGLALTLVAVYLAFHRRAGRL